jgi:3-hydroxybutyryl-CoA dehydrogenase
MQPVVPQPPFEIRTVAVIGAGTAGRRFALACAAAGFHVVLEDVMPANLRRAEADFAELNLRDSAGGFDLALTVEDAVREADIAIDFVPDELESKLEIFSMVDRMAPPRTILCTPSEALSITDLASCVYRPERCFAVREAWLVEISAQGRQCNCSFRRLPMSTRLERRVSFFARLALKCERSSIPMFPC